ncbi:MAG: CHASE domain-containing protein, partial [Ketobacteraceae bacterium]|nr:CHASE domain-containing protein [Ketobacteraceae bacterium]
IKAISLIPVVPRQQRQQFEELMARALDRPFMFKDRGDDGRLIPAKDREIYYPVYFIFPMAGNEQAHGFNLGSHAGRLRALEAAIEKQDMVVSEPIKLVQEQGRQLAFLLFTPVVTADGVSSLVSCVYRMGDLMESVVDDSELKQLSIQISDTTEPDAVKALYGNLTRATTIVLQKTIDIANRQWRVTYSPSTDFINRNMGFVVWVVLIAGFLVVAILGLFFLMIMSQKSAVENEVLRKTRALKLALEEAEEASRIKSTFLANMSHELRTPLNSIIGFTVRSLKALEGSGQERVVDSLRIVESNGKHLLALINDMLDLSKIEAGKLQIEKEPVDVPKVVAEVVTLMTPQAEARGLTVTSDNIPLNPLMADQKRLRQILLNLISNAIKFTDEGSVHVALQPEPRQGCNGLRITVRDTGKGIPEAELGKLFRRFEQLGQDMKIENLGTGLGLALVQELVELHGGEVGVSSREGEGSEFRVWLPDN